MSIRERFFEELQRAMVRGFTLAAVSAAMSCGPVRGSDGGSLAQVPAGALGCAGDGGDTSTCCTKLHCYQPPDGVCREGSTSLVLTPPLPPDAGTCLCQGVTGPFAQADGGRSECCYVAGTIGCPGRPLRDGDVAIVAALVARSDWA